MPEVTNFDDLRRDQVLVEVASFEDEHTGSGSHFWSPGQPINPVSDRNMVAELVAIDVGNLYVRGRSTSITITDFPGWIDARFELSTSESMENLPGVSSELKGPTGQGSDITTGDGPSMQLEHFEDTEIIKSWYMQYQSVMDDDTNGPGSGPAFQAIKDSLTNFRREFGQGPLFDRQDELWAHCMLQGIQAAEWDWQMVFDATFYWNDFEVDLPY